MHHPSNFCRRDIFRPCILFKQGAVGLAIWVPSVTNESKEGEALETKVATRGYSVLAPVVDKDSVGTWRRSDGDGLELSVMGSGGHHEHIEEELYLENLKVPFSISYMKLILTRKTYLCLQRSIIPVVRLNICLICLVFCDSTVISFFGCNQVSEAMTNKFVKVFLTLTIREALKCMHDGQQNCALVVDTEDHLEGILTFGDIKRSLSKNSSGASSSDSSVPDVCITLLYM